MRLLVILVALLALPAAATEVYRWVDANGQVHFSDQWRPGAEKLRIADAPGFSAPAPATRAPAAGRGATPAAAPAPLYETLEIASPAQEEVLWNTEGQLRVSMRLIPPLRPGHGLRLFLDGQQQEIPEGSTEVQLTEVFRGVHTLRAEVVDQAGTALITSPTTTFAVRQTSVLNPSRPIAP